MYIRDFTKEIQKLFPEVRTFVATALNQHPNLKIYICGHSLGGALALLCLAKFTFSESPRHITAVYTFGQPPVGMWNSLPSCALELAPQIFIEFRISVILAHSYLYQMQCTMGITYFALLIILNGM